MKLNEKEKCTRGEGVKMMSEGKGKIAIVGIGEVPCGVYPQRSQWDIIYDICIAAVQDSGLDKNDIEAVVTVAPQAQARLSARYPSERFLKSWG